MISFKPFDFLVGFGELVETSGATCVQVDVLRALLHRVAGRQNRDIVIAVDFGRREPSASTEY